MKRTPTTYEVFETDSKENRRLLSQEKLILEVTEEFFRVLDREGITKTQLAERLGRSKGFVSQVLSGERNLTLRTLADMAEALEHEIAFSLTQRVEQTGEWCHSKGGSFGYASSVRWRTSLPSVGPDDDLSPSVAA